MIPRQAKVELVALLLYCLVLIRADRSDGMRSAAHMCRWYAGVCRETGTWFYVQAIRAESAAKELIEP